MISNVLVEATERTEESRGKNEAKRLRVSGKIPAVVYGAGKGPQAIIVDPKAINKILQSDSGHNTIFDLSVGNAKDKVMISDWQYEPLKGKLLHIDMRRIAMDKKLRVKVPIHLTGTAEGVKTQGGILEQILREVEIECLPADIPSHIDADITHLVFGVVLRVADLPHGGTLKFLTDEDQTVAHVTTVKEVVEVAPAADAIAAAEPAEPEVIKKGKQDAEGDAAAPAAAPAKK